MHNKFFVYRIRDFFWLFCNLDQMIRVNNNVEPFKIHKMCLIENVMCAPKTHESIAHRNQRYFFLFTDEISVEMHCKKTHIAQLKYVSHAMLPVGFTIGCQFCLFYFNFQLFFCLLLNSLNQLISLSRLIFISTKLVRLW